MGRARKPLAAQKGDLTVARQVELEQAEAAVRTPTISAGRRSG